MHRILLLGEINKGKLIENLIGPISFVKNNPNMIIIRGSNYKLDRITLKKYKELKFIYVFGIGTDNIDLDYCKENNIIVSNEPKISAYSVAELTILMILSSLRQVYTGIRKINGGEYTRKDIGHNLTKKKIGVLGYGNIGSLVVELLHSFSEHSNFEIHSFDNGNPIYKPRKNLFIHKTLDEFKKI